VFVAIAIRIEDDGAVGFEQVLDGAFQGSEHCGLRFDADCIPMSRSRDMRLKSEGDGLLFDLDGVA
jgi:hypothetical protein